MMYSGCRVLVSKYVTKPCKKQCNTKILDILDYKVVDSVRTNVACLENLCWLVVGVISLEPTQQCVSRQLLPKRAYLLYFTPNDAVPCKLIDKKSAPVGYTNSDNSSAVSHSTSVQNYHTTSVRLR